jgi:hypothetical protein
MAKGTSKVVQVNIEERRRKVAQMYLAGKSQFEIGKVVGVSQVTVSHDLTALREEWAADTAMNFSQRMAEELAKIDRLEEVAWEEYKRSREDAKVLVARTESAPERKKEREDRTRLGRAGREAKASEPVGVIGQPVPLMEFRRVVEERTVGRLGDPRYLDRVSWCIETRLKLFGMLDAKQTATTNVQVNVINWDALTGRDETPDPIESRIDEVKALLPKRGLNGDGG